MSEEQPEKCSDCGAEKGSFKSCPHAWRHTYPSSTPLQSDWEKEFDDRFIVKTWVKKQTYHKGRWKYTVRNSEKTPEYIKSFIRSLLATSQQETLERVVEVIEGSKTVEGLKVYRLSTHPDLNPRELIAKDAVLRVLQETITPPK